MSSIYANLNNIESALVRESAPSHPAFEQHNHAATRMREPLMRLLAARQSGDANSEEQAVQDMEKIALELARERNNRADAQAPSGRSVTNHNELALNLLEEQIKQSRGNSSSKRERLNNSLAVGFPFGEVPELMAKVAKGLIKS